MIPAPTPPNIYGDLRSDIGAAGQNSPTPAEKAFSQHFIVKQGGRYFDPSYGTESLNASAYEQDAIFGYGYQEPEDEPLIRWRVCDARIPACAGQLRLDP